MNFIALESEQKLRGGYYTPDDLAQFLTRWIAPSSGTRILEPSCGDGAFFPSLKSSNATVTAFELSPEEAEKAKARGLPNCIIHNRDFLGWALQAQPSQFDAVIGNPPFIRYQYLPAAFQANAERVFAGLGCKFTKHTNAWVPFILASMNLLRPGGRLAMVVPSEIIHVMHAQSLRTYLGQQCRRLVIVDPQEIWFEGTLQGAVLLMAEKKASPEVHGEGLGIHRVAGREFLQQDPEAVFNAPQAINGKTVQGKWTRALVPAATLDILDTVEADERFCRFSDAATVDVGIVTGANKFFLVTDDVVRRNGLKKWAHPMFGRSDHCPGVIYDDAQHARNAATGKPTNFLWMPDTSVEKSVKGREYIAAGVREKLHERYKCRIRSPWYTVPSVYATEVGMLKRSHDTPRLILNRAGAYTTDTAYRIRALKGTADALVYGFYNSLTALSAELEGRHYGGGVLELVPSEIEKLLLPAPEAIVPDVERLDRMVREDTVSDTLEAQSEEVLGALSKADQMDLLAAWAALRDRRHRLPT
ncbi:N-6 DNA methylase [Ruegeria arenilitoris]|uniref:N-6 DNA methylase n=1 Tax=Ruegeria arenilitoris TaxID=1173585 RepID=UPI00147A2AD9|nr:N-6 DNA methylase [Ruegeria arenilitoris]